MEYFFTGICRWAKVFEPDTKFGPTYSIEMKLDDPDYKTYRDAGCQGELSKDGLGYLTFRRRDQILSRAGKLIKFGPPLVIDIEGKPFEESIGNGSEVTIKVVTFETEKGVGTRLEAVKVLKHVSYDNTDTQKNRDFAPRW